jgi:Uma2 family endonuclease
MQGSATESHAMGAVETDLVLNRHRLTVDEYYRMAEAGILAPQARVELIRGEVVDMAPMGSRHSGVVIRLTRRLVRAVGDDAIVSVQTPLRLGTASEPEPDLMVLLPRADDYATSHPGPNDVLLVIEVSDTTSRYDREIKLPLYAEQGIAEVWIVDLSASLLRIHRQPLGAEYAQTQVLTQPGIVDLPGLAGLQVDLSGLF